MKSKERGLGDEFLDALAAALELIEERGDSLPRLETFHSRRNVRRYTTLRFPFHVIFEIRETEILVIAVAHARRKPNYWARRK